MMKPSLNISLRLVIDLVGLLLLTACAALPQQQDAAPRERLDPNKLHDAVPKYETVGPAGNTSPYTVLGKEYRVLPSANGFTQEGVASWYGTKFHGKLTSNGESYDLYDMSAAHKTLPIPCYVRVRNLDNNKTAVVRVNDRGPFHDDRIIDLSYAAATKLGYVDLGTARVRIEAVSFDPPIQDKRYFLQAGAYQDYQAAQRHKTQLQALNSVPVVIRMGNDNLQRVQIGPLFWHELVALKDQLLAKNIKTSVVH